MQERRTAGWTITALLALGTAGAAAADRGAGAPAAEFERHWPMLEQYCTECHNFMDWAGGVAFDTMDPAAVPDDAEVWEAVVRKMRGALMPPPGNQIPERGDVDAFVTSLTAYLDEAADARGLQPGHVTVHRMNRREYAAAIEDLLGLRIDASDYLPGDISSAGFDNVASVLSVSPGFIDDYLAAARDISIRAVGDARAEANQHIYEPVHENQGVHIDGLPLGTSGGLVVEHHFPADGMYEFRFEVDSAEGSALRSYNRGWIEYEREAVLVIDGEEVFRGRLGGPEDLRAIDHRQVAAIDEIRGRFRGIRVEVEAGQRAVGATFIHRTFAESDKWIEPLVPGEGVRSVPVITEMEVLGPFEPTGIAGSTASRERIFVCYPEGDDPVAQRNCAQRILERLGERALRRPLDDADRTTLMRFYDAGYREGGFETGVQRGLMSILGSLNFLFRAPAPPPEGLQPGDVYEIDDFELASRLSFFLWSRMPDDELRTLAAAGRLNDPDVLRAQVERMLDDPRARTLVTNFAMQWLGVEAMDNVDPDVFLFPNFNEELRAAFRREIELFAESILLADRSVLELLTADHTYLNERLALHYGVPHVRGDRFRRVTLDDSRRWGVLGKGAVLMATSYAYRTSPVLRGEWIMAHLLATPPAPVPPGVETDLNIVGADLDRPLTTREKLELHRTEESCNQCHGVIDPLGQALENYNVVGEWREVERDSGVDVDPTGRLASGEEVAGPDDLREALVGQPGNFLHALTERLMTYALGRRLAYTDMPRVRQIVRHVGGEGDYRFAALVHGVVASPQFRMRTVPEDGADLPLTVDDTMAAEQRR